VLEDDSFLERVLNYRAIIVNRMADIEIIASVYTGKNRQGDFSYMIDKMLKEDRYDSLFVFNDNVEDHMTCIPGGGNAAIRVYNKFNKLRLPIPLSSGIPTGRKGQGGFMALNEIVIEEITLAISEIKKLMNLYKYKNLYFSVGEDGLIGSGIFQIADSVRQYITEQIYSLSIHKFARIRKAPSYQPKIESDNRSQWSNSFTRDQENQHNVVSHGSGKSDGKESVNFITKTIEERSDAKHDEYSYRGRSERPRSNPRTVREDVFVPYDKTKHYYSASGIFLYRKKGGDVEALLGKDFGWTILVSAFMFHCFCL
jgi:hypothetical protein